MQTGYELTVRGLNRLRDEVRVDLERSRQETARLQADLAGIDRVLGILGTAAEAVEKPIVDRSRHAILYRGELRSFAMASLTEHGPSTVRDLVERMIGNEPNSNDDRRLSADLVKRFGRALPRMEASGLVSKTPAGNGLANVWSVVGIAPPSFEDASADVQTLIEDKEVSNVIAGL